MGNIFSPFLCFVDDEFPNIFLVIFFFFSVFQLRIFPSPTTVARISSWPRSRCLDLWLAVKNSDLPSHLREPVSLDPST